jgi:hypothetical protein
VNLSSGTINYLAADALGSVRGVVSSTGALTASTSYGACGSPETSGGLTYTVRTTRGANDVVTLRNELLDYAGANDTGCSSDQDPHSSSLAWQASWLTCWLTTSRYRVD